MNGVILPVPVALSSNGFQVIDYRTKSATSQPAAGGVCEVIFEDVPSEYAWLVDRMVVACTSTEQTVARIYTDRQLVNATPTGNLDVDDASSPLLVDSTSSLSVTWSGASDGAIATARIQYRVMKRL